MAEFINEDGETVEAFTPEEVEAKVSEVKQQIEQEKTTLQEQLTEAQEALKKEQEKDKNFGLLKKGTKEEIEAKEAIITKLQETVNNINSKISKIEGVSIESKINSISNNDPELAKKVKFFYDKFTGEAENDEQIQERISNAYVLATKDSVKGNTKSSAFSTGGFTPKAPIASEKLSDDALDVARKMGLKEEELKDLK